MFFGAPVWPLQFFPPYDQVIRQIARLGFKGVELIGWTPEQLTDYYTPKTIESLHALIADHGLSLTNFNHSPAHLSSQDASVRVQAVEEFTRAIDVGAALGSPLITMVTPYPFGRKVAPLLDRPTTQEWTASIERHLDWSRNYEDYVVALASCCKAAGDVGVRVALEPHPYRWVSSGQTMLRLIEHAGATNLGLNLDPSHLFPSGDIPHYTAYMLGSRVYHTHFSDNDGQSNAHWRPGKGKVDWLALLQSLADVGYTGALSIELEQVPGSATAHRVSTPEIERELRLTMDYLRSVGTEAGLTIQ